MSGTLAIAIVATGIIAFLISRLIALKFKPNWLRWMVIGPLPFWLYALFLLVVLLVYPESWDSMGLWILIGLGLWPIYFAWGLGYLLGKLARPDTDVTASE